MCIELLKEALIGKGFRDRYYYIAHLLDKVIIGGENDQYFEEVKNAVEKCNILELHLFNEEKEIFAVRADGALKVYQLDGAKQEEEEHVIYRKYKIETAIKKYRYVETREYIAFDKETHMAYVNRTVLNKLIEGGEHE